MSGARRLLGVLLAAAALLPAHRLLDPARGGPAASATLSLGRAAYPMLVWGTVLALAAAVAMAVLLPSGGVRRAAHRLGEAALRPSPAAWALGVAAVALAASLGVALVVLRATPTLLDEMVQLLHARALAAGSLAAPLPSPEAARLVQNGVPTPLGWASVYAPGHTVLLAAGLAAGAAWMVGPVLLALTAAASALAFERLLPERLATARLSGLLVGLSPFMVALGAGYLSHTAAAAFGALALLAALRARDGSPGWAAAAGLAMGAMVATRPWTGLALGGALTAGVWMSAMRPPGRGGRWLGARLGAWAAGGAPVAVLLGLWNHNLFGHPLRLGYEAAFGPAHGLGFQRDPWGNLYGVREAVAYTGFDLAMLGTHLLETPLPVVALVGAWLAVTPRLPRGSGVLLAWALVPVAANALYWHHGYHMGPRMLYEAAPAWLALAALAVVGLARGDIGEASAGATAEGAPARAVAEARARDAVVWLALVLAGAAVLLQVPARLGSYRPAVAFLAASRPPAPPGDAPALVFAHGSWSGRVAARLAGAGMRRDSIETALRRNALCRVHLHALERARRGPAAAQAEIPLDLEPLPGTPPNLRLAEVAPGNVVRVEPDEPLDPSCLAEVAADRMGVVELAPLLWRTALPGGGRVLMVRDLGPADNRRVRDAFPGREAWIWVPRDPNGAPRLLPYDVGEAALWGEVP